MSKPSKGRASRTSPEGETVHRRGEEYLFSKIEQRARARTSSGVAFEFSGGFACRSAVYTSTNPCSTFMASAAAKRWDPSSQTLPVAKPSLMASAARRLRSARSVRPFRLMGSFSFMALPF